MPQLLLQRIVHDLGGTQSPDACRYIILVKLLGMLFGIVLQHLESNILEGEPAIEVRLLEYTTSVLLAYSFLGTTEGDILGEISWQSVSEATSNFCSKKSGS